MNVALRLLLAAGIFCLHLIANAQSGHELLRKAGVSYSPPEGWVVEDFPDHKGTFMYALAGPDTVEASIGIELVSRGNDSRTIQQRLQDQSAKATATDPTRKELRRVVTRINGKLFGRVDYVKTRNGVDLVESVSIITASAGDLVFIYTSATKLDHPKHASTIDEFIRSVSVAQ